MDPKGKDFVVIPALIHSESLPSKFNFPYLPAFEIVQKNSSKNNICWSISINNSTSLWGFSFRCPLKQTFFFKLFSPEKTVCRLKTLVFFRSGPIEGPKSSYLSSQKLLRFNIPNFESKRRFLLLSASSSIVHRQ